MQTGEWSDIRRYYLTLITYRSICIGNVEIVELYSSRQDPNCSTGCVTSSSIGGNVVRECDSITSVRTSCTRFSVDYNISSTDLELACVGTRVDIVYIAAKEIGDFK